MTEKQTEEKRIVFEVRKLHNSIKRYVDKSGVKAEVEKLTGLHGWVIGYIANSDRPVFGCDLEERFGVRRSTMSNILDTMERNGLVYRKDCDCDKRKKQLVLTDKALEIHKRVTADMKKTEDCLKYGLSKEELSQFFVTLDKICANLDRQNTEEKHD